MPSKIQNANATGRLLRFFDVKGRFLPQLDEIVVPVALVADLSEEPSTATPPIFTERFTLGPIAGEGCEVLFRGVLDGAVCLPLAILPRGSASSAYEISLENNPLAVLLNNPVSTRGVALTGTHGEGPITVQGGTSAALTGNAVGMFDEAGTTSNSPEPISLEGWGLRFEDVLRIRQATVNIICDFTMWWTYRAA